MRKIHSVSRPGFGNLFHAGLLASLAFLLTSCATLRDARLEQEAKRAHGIPLYRGDTGARIYWNDLRQELWRADIIVVGETHDDAHAHAFERALLSELLEEWPQSALSLEVFERNEQTALDRYVRGDSSLRVLFDATNSKEWGSWKHWRASYGALAAIARRRQAAVIGANAPREHVSTAREKGFEALKELPPEQQAHFTIPASVDDSDYFQRFKDAMTGHHSAGNSSESGHAQPGSMPDEMILAYFRSQQLWDATMAASMANALGKHQKVMHVVGQFHSDYQGGLVKRIQHRAPEATILTISLVRSQGPLSKQDANRADVVAYTADPASALLFVQD